MKTVLALLIFIGSTAFAGTTVYIGGVGGGGGGGSATVSNPSTNSIVTTDAVGNLKGTECTIPEISNGVFSGVSCDRPNGFSSSLTIESDIGQAPWTASSVAFTLPVNTNLATSNRVVEASNTGVFGFEKIHLSGTHDQVVNTSQLQIYPAPDVDTLLESIVCVSDQSGQPQDTGLVKGVIFPDATGTATCSVLWGLGASPFTAPTYASAVPTSWSSLVSKVNTDCAPNNKLPAGGSMQVGLGQIQAASGAWQRCTITLVPTN